MDHKALTRSTIKHQIKAGHFEALLQGFSAMEYRQIVTEALDELEERKPEGLKVVPDTIQFPKPGPFESEFPEPPGDDIVPIG